MVGTVVPSVVVIVVSTMMIVGRAAGVTYHGPSIDRATSAIVSDQAADFVHLVTAASAVV